MVVTFTKTEKFTKAGGITILKKVLALTTIIMVSVTMENGKITRRTGKVLLITRTGVSFRASLKTIKNMV